MKYLFLFIFSMTHAIAQSSYSAADQDTQNKETGTELDTGYVNKDAENQDMNFSGEMSSTASKSQNQDEPSELSSGNNASKKRVKTSKDD